MIACTAFSTFRQNFPKSVCVEFVKARYVDHILAAAAKDPSYRWACPFEVRILTADPYASKRFSQGTGPIIKSATIKFGNVVNRDLVLSW